MSTAAAAPRFVVGVLAPGSDIMQIYSSLLHAGCSEISFVKDLKNSILCKSAAEESESSSPTNGVKEDLPQPETSRRKRKAPQVFQHRSPSSSPSINGTPTLPVTSPEQNLSLVLNGIVQSESLALREAKSESPFLQSIFADAVQDVLPPSQSPQFSDAIENAPYLLSRVFGVNIDKSENSVNLSSVFEEGEEDSNMDQEQTEGSGRRRGPIVECQKCTSKIIMQQTRSLFRHIMTHASQEPYRCSECLQSSANSFNLRTHIHRKHLGQAQILPNRTTDLEAEWRSLARECFPLFQDRIDKCISYFVNSGPESLPLDGTEKRRSLKENKAPALDFVVKSEPTAV